MPKLRPLHVGKFIDLEPLELRGLGSRRVRAYEPHRRKGDGPRPLLLLFDGQNVFSDEGSFAGGWFAHESVDKLARWKPTPPLLVALDHGHHARIDELTPFSDGRHGGKLDVVGGSIIRKLLPRLHERFDLGACYVGGSSLGGLAALYMHLARPDVFAGAIAMSPSLWFEQKKLDAFIRAQPKPKVSRIYIDAAAHEGNGTIPRLVRRLGSYLHARGWQPAAERQDHRLVVRIDARGKHNERSWRKRLPMALRLICAE